MLSLPWERETTLDRLGSMLTITSYDQCALAAHITVVKLFSQQTVQQQQLNKRSDTVAYKARGP